MQGNRICLLAVLAVSPCTQERDAGFGFRDRLGCRSFILYTGTRCRHEQLLERVRRGQFNLAHRNEMQEARTLSYNQTEKDCHQQMRN